MNEYERGKVREFLHRLDEGKITERLVVKELLALPLSEHARLAAVICVQAATANRLSLWQVAAVLLT